MKAVENLIDYLPYQERRRLVQKYFSCVVVLPLFCRDGPTETDEAPKWVHFLVTSESNPPSCLPFPASSHSLVPHQPVMGSWMCFTPPSIIIREKGRRRRTVAKMKWYARKNNTITRKQCWQQLVLPGHSHQDSDWVEGRKKDALPWL